MTTIRRLGPGDEGVVASLADDSPRTELLADDRTIFLVAFEADVPVGFVLAHELPRRHKAARSLLVYEIEVTAAQRRRGIGTGLMRELERLARRRRIEAGWVLTERANEAAMRFHEAAGAVRPKDVVEWELVYAAR